jgi:hypothetical protein
MAALTRPALPRISFLLTPSLSGASLSAVPCAPSIKAVARKGNANIMPGRLRKTIATLKLERFETAGLRSLGNATLETCIT